MDAPFCWLCTALSHTNTHTPPIFFFGSLCCGCCGQTDNKRVLKIAPNGKRTDMGKLSTIESKGTTHLYQGLTVAQI